MLPEADRSLTVCGAKRRRGGVCDAAPAAGKRRCHAHGGAPRTGAPRGNLNALMHGGFVGGRQLLMRAERSRLEKHGPTATKGVKRLERDARAITSGLAHKMDPPGAILAPSWPGPAMGKIVEQWKIDIENEILSALRAGYVDLHADIAARDVLHCLSQEDDETFASSERFGLAICRVFYYLDHGTWPLRAIGTPYARVYYARWRHYCAQLYELALPCEEG